MPIKTIQKNEDEEYDDIIKKADIYTNESYLKLLNKYREIFLFNSIDNKASESIYCQIRGMNYLDSKTPIKLYINSSGGVITDGLAILDCIQGSKAPIYTIITGEAASMAGLISIVGKKRFMTKNAVWMMHSSSTAIGDYIQRVQDRTTYIFKLEERMNHIIKKHTKIRKKQMRQIENSELWVFATEAKKYGIVDRII